MVASPFVKTAWVDRSVDPDGPKYDASAVNYRDAWFEELDQRTNDLADGLADADAATIGGLPVVLNTPADGQVLKLNSSLEWTNAADLVGSGGGGGSAINLELNDSLIVEGATTLDFSSVFTMTNSPAGEGNVDVKDATESQRGVRRLATQAETNTGTADDLILTPLKLANRTATTTRAGVVPLADNSEAQAGSNSTKAVTPAALASRTALDTRTGLIRIATSGEVAALTATDVAMTPAQLASVFEESANKGAASGYASLDGSGKVPSTQLPSTGYTPPWIKTGAGVTYAAFADGNPERMRHLIDTGTTVTANNIGSTTGRLVSFMLPKALALTGMRIWVVSSVAANAWLSIFADGPGFAQVYASGALTISADSFGGPTGITGVTLAADTVYWVMLQQNASGTTAKYLTCPIPRNSGVYGTDGSGIGGKSVGVAVQAQATVSNGVVPSALTGTNALAAPGFTVGGAPLVFLDGTAS